MRADVATAFSLAVSMALVSLVVLRLIDLNEKEPLWAMGLLLWLGVVAAGVAALVTDQRAGHESPLGIALAAEVGKTVAVGAGMGLLLLVARRRGFSEVNGLVDAIVYGAVAGAGFAVGDTFLRETFASARELQTPVRTGTLDLLWMSVQSGLSEALFGAMIGAGIGVAVQARSLLARAFFPVAGIGAAFIAHLGYVELVLDGGPIRPEFSAKSAVAALLLPAAVGAAVVYALRGEKRAILKELKEEEEEDDERVVTKDEVGWFEHPAQRHRQYGAAFLVGDLDRLLYLRRLQNRLVQLAWAKQRERDPPPDEAASTAAEVERIRDAIREIRARAERRQAGRDERHALRDRLRGPALAATGVATGIVAGGVVVMAIASGGHAPTSVATRSSQFEREQARSSERQGQVALRERISDYVGEFALADARDDDRPGAQHAYRVTYAADGGRRLTYSLAVFPTPAGAERARRGLLGHGATGRRVWASGAILSSVTGRPRDVEEFVCRASPTYRRPNLLPLFHAAMAKALPSAWEDLGGEQRINLASHDRRANFVATSEPWDGNLVDYSNDFAGTGTIPSFHQLDFAYTELGPGRTAVQRSYLSHPRGSFRVLTVDVYYLECGVGYTFRARAPAATARRYEAAIDQIAAAANNAR
jgi:hypothetical protein